MHRIACPRTQFIFKTLPSVSIFIEKDEICFCNEICKNKHSLLINGNCTQIEFQHQPQKDTKKNRKKKGKF